jgi:3-deoxy-D-manno-octulosonic-acid transferase
VLTIYLWLQPFLLWLLGRAARHSDRLQEFLRAREGLLERWRRAQLGENRVWFHVSSVGELEQARPVMEFLTAGGRHSVVVSYFSISVPRLVKDWSFVTHADYLPLDTPEAMRELVALIKPRALVLNRYDLWPNHILATKAAGVPVVVINASTPPQGWFGRLSLWARRRIFAAVDAWTFVDAAAASSWEPYLNEQARGLVAGNPRVDRALARAERLIAEGRARERLRLWKKRAFCLVAGSTWPPDEEVILDAWALRGRDKIRESSLVLVPHEPEEAHVQQLEREIANRGFSSVRLSRIGVEGSSAGADVLVVDLRGFLAEIYGLGNLSYVGGGFGRQIHSIIEPVAHGLLVAFGPHYDRSPEAFTLKAVGSAFSLTGSRKAARLASWMDEMERPGEEKKRAEESLRVFLQMHRGAGERVGRFLEERMTSRDREFSRLAEAEK